MKYFYDTNILLSSELNTIPTPFYVSSVTLQELEHIKTSAKKSDDIKYKARKATRWLSKNEDKYICVHRTKFTDAICGKYFVDETVPDNQIVSCCKKLSEAEEVTFVTNDIACYNTAKNVFELPCMHLQTKSNDYRGYHYISVNGTDYTNIFNEYAQGKNLFNLIENQYLIIKDTDSNKEYEYVYRKNELCQLKLPKGIKGKNAKQRCALDLLYNTNIPIKVIAGVYGSGKTYIAVRTGLIHVKERGNYSSIMLVRNPTGSGEEVGFLPGDIEDKTKDFFAPFIDNLEGGEYELEDMKRQGKIQTQIPFYLKGRSIASTFIVVDEAEDLTMKDFRLIGSRIAEGSSVVFTGDFKQAETKYIYNNGLSKFIQYISENPSPLVGVVVLDDDVRSDASKYFVNFE